MMVTGALAGPTVGWSIPAFPQLLPLLILGTHMIAGQQLEINRILPRVYPLESGQNATFVCSYPCSDSGAHGWCVSSKTNGSIAQPLGDFRDSTYSYISRSVNISTCASETEKLTHTLTLMNASKNYSEHVIFCASSCNNYFDIYNNDHIMLYVSDPCVQPAPLSSGNTVTRTVVLTSYLPAPTPTRCIPEGSTSQSPTASSWPDMTPTMTSCGTSGGIRVRGGTMWGMFTLVLACATYAVW